MPYSAPSGFASFGGWNRGDWVGSIVEFLSSRKSVSERLWSYLKVRPKVRSRAISLYKGSSRLWARAWGRGRTNVPKPASITSSRDWVEHWSQRHGGARWSPAGEDEYLENVAPRNLRGYIDREYQEVQRMVSPAPFVVEVLEGRLVGDQGVLVTPDQKILLDVSFPIGPNRAYFNANATTFVEKIGDQDFPFAEELYKDAMLPAKRLSGTAALLTSYGGRGYFHWMFDVIPRLGLLDKAGYSLDEIDHFVIPMRVAGFHFETLETLGIAEKKLISSFNQRNIVADRVLAPSLTRPSWAVPTWVVEYLRSAFPPLVPSANVSSRRLYITRKATDHGVVSNEDRLTAQLRKRGFEPVAMEDFSIREKAWLLGQAEAVLSVSGAGLSNVVFCKPGTKVVEIRVRPFPVKEQWAIANRCDLDYYDVLPAETIRPNGTAEIGGKASDESIFATLDMAGLT